MSPETLARFRQATQIDLPDLPPAQAAVYIAAHLRKEWTRWKCEVTVEQVRDHMVATALAVAAGAPASAGSPARGR